MKALVRVVAVICCLAPHASPAQSGLAYDFSFKERVDGTSQMSTGHAVATAGAVRMDFLGKTSLSRIATTDLSDSMSVIATDTGMARVVTLENHRGHEYVQFAPAAMMAKMSAALSQMPGVSAMDFTGSTVTIDSLGPADSISGYPTILYRLTLTIKPSMSGQPLGTQDALMDYYVAPDLKDFAIGNSIIGEATDETSSIPGFPKALSEQLKAAAKRISTGLALRTSIDLRSNMFGTGSMRMQMMEISNVKKADVPASAFVVPPGYKRVVPKGMEKFM